MASAKISLKDGRWLLMKLPSVNQQLDIIDLTEADTAEANVERMRFFRDLFREVTEETSWGSDPGDLTPDEMLAIVPLWMRAREDDAVPPESGSSSERPPSQPRSRRQTASKPRSARRASS